MNNLRRRALLFNDKKPFFDGNLVDLGLPSGTLWGDRNIGSYPSYGSGLYYSWGNVEGHQWGDGYNFSEDNYALTPGGQLTGDIPMTEEYDAAYKETNGLLRIPTKWQIDELVEGTTTSDRTVSSGSTYKRFTSKSNGKYIEFQMNGAVRLIGTTKGVSMGVPYNSYYDSTAAYVLALYYNGSPLGTPTISTWLRHSGNMIRGCTPYKQQYVDLGLPSGTKWATCNLGASQPTDAGLYFSWGNVEGHAKGSGYNFDATAYNSTPGKALTGDIPVNATYDAAQYMLGEDWRLPTRTEFKELYDNTDSEWTTINSVAGRKFMKKSDHSVYIFFPACGYCRSTAISDEGKGGNYWSSTYYSSSNAYYMDFYSGYVRPEINYSRNYGFSCRAVMDTV